MERVTMCRAAGKPTYAKRRKAYKCVHIAKVEVRERKHHDLPAAERAHERLYDLLMGSDYPNTTLRALVGRLGRHTSLSIGIDRPVVDLALAESAF